ncbi:5-methyltetrahydrofolate, partial [Operophtera brumata]
IVVLDGGFSTQLSCHVGHVIDGDPLWSARFLHTHPDEIVNTHLDFLRGDSRGVRGAPRSHRRAGLRADQHMPLVVGSVGPYGAHLHDGSEYDGSYADTTSVQDDQSIAHGESFQKVAKKCWESNPDQLVAIGVNCCAPSFIANLVKGINDDRPQAPIPLIQWLDLGVRYVGGCCRTYAADVSRIRNQVRCWRDRYRFRAKYQPTINEA